MKEVRWQAETAAPDIMLKFVRDVISDRQLRLFAVACCRRIWHLIPSDEGRNAVDVINDTLDPDAEPRIMKAIPVHPLAKNEPAQATTKTKPNGTPTVKKAIPLKKPRKD